MSVNILLIFVVLTLLIASWAIYLGLKNKQQIRNLLGGDETHNTIVDLLSQHYSDQKLVMESVQEQKLLLEQLSKNSKKAIQNIGLVRFNPFRDTGGDQSFALCLLDENESGLLITAIHSREGTRIYTKSVSQRKTTQDLSKEERAALSSALE